MSEEQAPTEPTLVEKWIKDQQDWQRTWTEYFDSMVKNDEFLVHLGNAMRGSLLAGKAYPGTGEPPAEEAEQPASTPADDRLDTILHALHRLQGEVADLRMTVEDLARQRPASTPPEAPAPGVAAEPPPAPDAPQSTPPNPASGDLDRGGD